MTIKVTSTDHGTRTMPRLSMLFAVDFKSQLEAKDVIIA
jgi:hypothetical protein